MVRCDDETLKVVGYKDYGYYEMPNDLKKAFAALENSGLNIRTTKSPNIHWVKLIYAKEKPQNDYN